MVATSFHRQRRVAALALFLMASVASAQATLSPAPPSDDPAVRLSANMRELGRNPNSVPALTGAGESALAVGDADAAFNFLSRAQELSPVDGRIKALLGSTLVVMERPADAMRLFSEAQMLGVSDRLILKDRGLAHDLLGNQKAAQKDYQAFLRSYPDDEVTRRYALSLGIGGDRDKALEMLNPLLRKRDQSAWRARTFILAMAGNLREADTIAAQVMPSDNGESLKPFLRRLAVLTPAQQALAVNFGVMPAGDVPMQPSRPAQVALAPAPAQPVERAESARTSKRASRRDEEESPSWSSGNRRSKKGKNDIAMASVAAPEISGPVAPPSDASVPGFAIDGVAAVASIPPPSASISYPIRSAPPPPAPKPPTETVMVAKTSAIPTATRVGARLGPVDPERLPVEVRTPNVTTATPAIVKPVPAKPDTVVATRMTEMPRPGGSVASVIPSTPLPAAPAIVSDPKPTVVKPADPTPKPVFEIATPEVKIVDAPAKPVVVAQAEAPVRVVEPAPTPTVVSPPVVAAAALTSPAETALVVAPQPALTAPAVPASVVEKPAIAGPPIELASLPPSTASQSSVVVAPAPAPTPGFDATEVVETATPQSAVPATVTVAQAVVETAPVAPSAPTEEAGLSSIIAGLTPEEQSAAGPLPSDADIRAARLAARKKEQAEAAAKLEADKKKKEAEAKKAEEEKEKAAELAKAKANPSRMWVQIATGSNKAGLGTTVRNVRAKAPKVMGSLAGWYAPVRATNRILVGPIKGAGEAKTLVNALAKEGVQANLWTSDAGEEVFRIGK